MVHYARKNAEMNLKSTTTSGFNFWIINLQFTNGGYTSPGLTVTYLAILFNQTISLVVISFEPLANSSYLTSFERRGEYVIINIKQDSTAEWQLSCLVNWVKISTKCQFKSSARLHVCENKTAQIQTKKNIIIS